MPTTDNTVSSSTANDKEQLVEMTFWDHLDAMRLVSPRACCHCRDSAFGRILYRNARPV